MEASHVLAHISHPISHFQPGYKRTHLRVLSSSRDNTTPWSFIVFNCVTLQIEFLVLNIRPSFKLGIKKAKKNPNFFSQIFSSGSDMIVTGIPQARLIWFPLSSDASFLTHSQSHKVLVLTSLAQPIAGYTL